MELIDRKRIKNGVLPGYDKGKDPVQPSKFKQFIKTNLHGPSQADAAGMVGGAVSFAGETMNAFGPVKSSSDLLAESGSTTAEGSGFSYEKQNQVDAGAQMAELGKLNTANTLKTAAAGASLGAAFGPIGAGIGGVVGGAVGFIGGLVRKSKLRRKIENAQMLAVTNNNYGLASAQGDYLASQYNLEHDNTQDDQLYSAANGKMPVHSPHGLVNAKATARVSNGEIIASPDGSMYRVPGKKNNKDTKLANISAEDAVITNKYGISDYVAATGDVVGGLEMLKNMKDFLTIKQVANGKYKAANGKLPGFVGGKYNTLPDSLMQTFNPLDNEYGSWDKEMDKTRVTVSPYLLYNDLTDGGKYTDGTNHFRDTVSSDRYIQPTITEKPKEGGDDYEDTTGSKRTSPWIPAILGGLGAAVSYSQRAKGALGKSDTYTKNPYVKQVSTALSNLRPNIYPQMEAARGAERRNNYAMRQMGSRGGSYIPAAVAANIGLLRNYADILAKGNQERNGYIANWANMMGNLGSQDQQIRQRALMNDYDTYAKSRGAMIKQNSVADYGALNSILGAYKNIDKLRMWQDQMSRYDQDYQLRKRALNNWG